MIIRKHSRSSRRGQRRGSALLVALLSVTTVSIMGAGFLQLTSSVMRRQTQGINNKQAFYLAEAGLAEAWVGILMGKSGNVGTSAEPARFGEGLFWVEHIDNPDGTVTLRSTGLSGYGRKTLDVIVEYPNNAASDLTIFSEEDLVIRPGTTIDSFNSRTGEVDEDIQLKLQSNGNIEVGGTEDNPTNVAGTVLSGADNTSVVARNATVEEASNAQNDLVLDLVDAPDVSLDSGIDHSAAVPLVLPTGNQAYEGLVVHANSEVRIQGPTNILLGDLAVEPGGRLIFDACNGPIRMILSGNAHLDAGSLIESTEQDATKVEILVEGAMQLTFSSTGSFYGMIYAPEAEVSLNAPFELYGSALANSLALSEDLQVHFDQALDIKAQQAKMPKFMGWVSAELPNAVGSSMSGNPFTDMGVDASLLPSPTKAHEGVLLELDYLDWTGTPQTFAGAEDSFNWGLVMETVDADRDGKPTPAAEAIPFVP